MAKSYLGVEIGSSRIKLAEMKGDELTRFLKADVPEGIVKNGMIASWDAMRDFLQEIVKENKIRTNNVCLALPDNATYTRRMNLPAMTTAQLEVNLPYEFRDFITDDKDSYIYDYAVINLIKNEEGKITDMDLLGVAVSKDLMNHYKELFRSCGLKLVMAAPQCLAFSSLMKRIDEEQTESDYAILDLGYDAVRVNIYSKGVFDTSRTIDTGCRSLAQKAAGQMNCDEHIAALYLVQNKDGIMDSEMMRDAMSEIAVDVMRAINYYTYEKRDNTLEKLYVSGGGSLIPQLMDELKDAVPLECVPMKDLANENMDNEDALTNGPACVGICWNEGETA